MNKWSSYGRWRHPIMWWQCMLDAYLRVKAPELLTFNPKVLEVKEDMIKFAVDCDEKVYILKKIKIMGVLHPEEN